MVYNVYRPSAPLSEHIKCYWSLQADETQTAAGKERIFPDGCTELIFHYGSLFKRHMTSNQSHMQPRSFVHGQLKQYMDIEATGAIGIFSVRFRPGGLQAFMPDDVCRVTELSVNLHDIWQQEGKYLEEKMLHAADDHHRVSIVETFLLRRYQAARANNGLVNHSVHLILQNAGNIEIERLAQILNISKRHVERRFINEVGIAPKLFSRIVRFNGMLARINEWEDTHLTRLAYEGGFSDQSHFIRDFRAFTGMAPKQYYKDRPELVRLFTSG